MMTPEEIENTRKLYKRLLTTDDGVKVLEDMKARFYYNRSTFSTDPHEIAYNEGQRTVLMFLMAMIEDKPTITEMEKIDE